MMPHSPPREGKFTRFLPRGHSHIGKRGAILLTFGLLWIVLGLSTLDSKNAIPGLLHMMIPVEWRGAAWIATGTFAIIFAYRPPGLSDGYGFLALYLMPTLRFVSYLLGWLDSVSWLPFLTGPGYDQGWKVAAIYGTMVAAVMITASWPEPASVPQSLDNEDWDYDAR